MSEFLIDPGYYGDIDRVWQSLGPEDVDGYWGTEDQGFSSAPAEFADGNSGGTTWVDGQSADYLPSYGEDGPPEDQYVPEQATWDADNYDGYAPSEAWESAE